jgi:hypothetical protein
MHRRIILLVVVALCAGGLVLSHLGCVHAPTSAQGHQRAGDASDTADLAVDWQNAYVGLRDDVVNTSTATGQYVASAIDYPRRQLVVFGTGHAPSAVQELIDHAPSDFMITWRSVPYSNAQFQRAESLVAKQLDFDSAGPSETFQSLEVTPVDRSADVTLALQVRHRYAVRLLARERAASAVSIIPITFTRPVPRVTGVEYDAAHSSQPHINVATSITILSGRASITPPGDLMMFG